MENVDFHNFLDRMRNPAAADLVRSIKGFIINFTSNPPNPEIDSNSVQEFMSSMEGMFKVHSLWAGATDEELDSAGEGLEKYLMTKLFSRAFAPLPEDAEHDQKISDKICLLQQFIRPEHLDIPPDFQNETSWLLAQKELQKINTYKAPRDKLVCILNCCRVINNLLLKVSMATNNNPPGADDFLPVLIYVTIKANPPQLHSNLLYIQRYRHQSRLVSEAAYFYTNLVSAESFIENLVAGSVSMDEKEFEKKMQAARAAVNGTNNHLTIEPVSTSVDSILPSQTSSKVQKGVSGVSALVGGESRLGESPPSKTIPSTVVMNNPETVDSAMSVTNLEAKGAFAVLDSDRTGRLAQDYPFLYASAGDLRVEDVESLLNAYKELVLRYCALCKAVEDMTSLKATLGDGEPQKDSAGMAIFNADGQRTQSSAQQEGSSDFSEGGLQRRVYASKESESEVEKHSFENPLLPPKSDPGVLDGLTIHGVTDIIENRDAILEVEKKVYEEDLNKILDSDTLKEHPDGAISNDIGIEEREILMQDFQNDKLEGVDRNDVGMKEES